MRHGAHDSFLGMQSEGQLGQENKFERAPFNEPAPLSLNVISEQNNHH